MDRETPVSDLERRKLVRLRLRKDLSVTPQKYEGRTYYVVKDPVSLRYYRFREHEHFLMRLMDGTTTLDDAQKKFEDHFRPDRMKLEELEGFSQQLLKAGLVQNEAPQAGQQLFDNRKKRLRSEWMQALTNILYIKIPLFDPDKLLDQMLPYCRWIFTTWFMHLSVGVMLAALLLVATHFETFWDKLPSYHEFFSPKNLVTMWGILGVVKVIHEFGHGLTCKAYKGEIHEMGLLFLVFSPAMYCNVSDAWVLPNKWHRILISFAGIYVELIIAALATFVWWNSPGQPIINHLSLSLMVVCSVSTVVFNANPLMRYDGYYVLSDLLEIPNLRDRSNKFLQRLVMDHCLGIEVQPEQYMALWRRILFVVYAIVSYIYRWVVTFSILWFMYNFLKPYKLGAISAMLAVAAAGSMVGWPLYRLGKNLHKRGRLPEMKPLRVSVSAGLLAAAVLFVFLVPLPVARVRQSALVQIEPEAQVPVYVRIPGILEKLAVTDGQEVVEGQILAEFRSLEEENHMEEAQAQLHVSEVRIHSLTEQLDDPSLSPSDRGELLSVKAEAEGDYQSYDKQVKEYARRKQSLVLRAPRAGVVINPPHKDEVGKLWDREQGTPFCNIGDPDKLRVLMPVSPADYRLLRDDLEEFRKRNEALKEGQRKKQELEVTIRVQGRGAATWTGELTQLPESEAKNIPLPLTNKAGGPVAVKQSNRPNEYSPQNQQYLLAITMVDPDHAICPGTKAQVKIHCKWRTCAWWAWRQLNTTFDLGLI